MFAYNEKQTLVLLMLLALPSCFAEKGVQFFQKLNDFFHRNLVHDVFESADARRPALVTGNTPVNL